MYVCKLIFSIYLRIDFIKCIFIITMTALFFERMNESITYKKYLQIEQRLNKLL